MTTFFDHHEFDDHEQLVFLSDAATGLKAVVAIHDTGRGPALGGCRMFPYDNEADALTDVLRLSRGMTYKSAIAGLPLGGGKSVVIGDPRKDKHGALLRRLGEFVEYLGGRYIVAEDSGTTQDDMKVISNATRFVAGVEGDPSPYTALGVYHGIKAAVAHRYGRSSLDGVKVAIQGVGNVGRHLAGLLHDAGAMLWVSDISVQRLTRVADETGAAVVAADAIFEQQVDVFAPCAMGAVINDRTLPRLRASIVAGAANNQLQSEHHGERLHQRGILYAPDYVVNAGGVIAVWYEYSGSDPASLPTRVERIQIKLTEIFTQAHKRRQSPNRIANQIAAACLRTRPDATLLEAV